MALYDESYTRSFLTRHGCNVTDVRMTIMRELPALNDADILAVEDSIDLDDSALLDQALANLNAWHIPARVESEVLVEEREFLLAASSPGAAMRYLMRLVVEAEGVTQNILDALGSPAGDREIARRWETARNMTGIYRRPRIVGKDAHDLVGPLGHALYHYTSLSGYRMGERPGY